MRRTLRPGGALVIDAQNRAVSLPHRQRKGLDRYPVFDALYAHEELVGEIEAAGFRLAHTAGLIRHFGLQSRLNRLRHHGLSGPAGGAHRAARMAARTRALDVDGAGGGRVVIAAEDTHHGDALTRDDGLYVRLAGIGASLTSDDAGFAEYRRQAPRPTAGTRRRDDGTAHPRPPALARRRAAEALAGVSRSGGMGPSRPRSLPARHGGSRGFASTTCRICTCASTGTDGSWSSRATTTTGSARRRVAIG